MQGFNLSALIFTVKFMIQKRLPNGSLFLIARAVRMNLLKRITADVF